MDTKYVLICTIVNAGYGNGMMLAARQAGATGGTLLKARGTGTEEDVKFFGITLMPEKEMVLIVAERSGADELMEVLGTVSLLSEPGSGIVFSIPVEDLITLGKKAANA